MADPLDLPGLAERAGVPLAVAEHFAPLLALLAAMRPASPERPAQSLDLASLPAGLELWRAYTVEEAAGLLGLKRPGTLYEIDERELPRCRVGPTRTAVRFLGLDLLCYMKGLAPIDYLALRERCLPGTD